MPFASVSQACTPWLWLSSACTQSFEVKVHCVRLLWVFDQRATQPDDVPAHVRELLHSVSDSYEKLHTLLALFTQSAGASVISLSESLGLDEVTVVNALEALRRAGSVKPEAQRRFVYIPDHGRRDASVEWLATHREVASVAIAKLLNDIALSRVRVALRGRLSFVIATQPAPDVAELLENRLGSAGAADTTGD